MSTLNLPAIIARLHNAADNYAKKGKSTKHDLLLSNGYRNFKIPEIVRHVGIGDRGWMSLQGNVAFQSSFFYQNSLWNQTLYLDQVLRRHPNNESDAGKAILSKYARRKRPRFLPKLDDKPVENSHTAAPYIRGQKTETHRLGPKHDANERYYQFDEEDEDAEWTRNALDGNTSHEIVQAYRHETVKQTPNLKGEQGDATTLVKHPPLPPIKKQADVVSEYREEVEEMQIDVRGEDNKKQIPKFVLHTFDFGDMRSKKSERMFTKTNMFVPNLEQKAAPVTKVDRIANTHNQSTFSRILNPDPNPKTQAGKKLLTSLLGRMEKDKRTTNKQEPTVLQKSNSILYSEEYMRLVDNKGVKNVAKAAFNQQEKSSTIDRKIGEFSFDKLPADLVGQHFQQTYEHLWKYLVHNGRRNLPKSYFSSKKELQKNNPGVIYIPTGRPEEALYVEGVERKYLSQNQQSDKPIKLKYNHRNDADENHTVSRSKDTSPWDIDEQLKTPEEPSKLTGKVILTEMKNSIQRVPNAEFDKQHEGYNDNGIKSISITLPPPEINAPPCTPASSHDNHHPNQEHLGAKINLPEFGAKALKQPREDLVYPTPKKNVRFKAVGKTSEENQKIGHRRGLGPVPEKNNRPTQQSKQGSKKTRTYTHGQYHIKVDEKIVYKRKPKLPKDLSNMFTKPYTFSYLTGVKAPGTSSSTLFAGKIANLSVRNKPQVAPLHNSTLISEIHHPVYDVNDNDALPNTTQKDASTQIDEDDDNVSLSIPYSLFSENETLVTKELISSENSPKIKLRSPLPDAEEKSTSRSIDHRKTSSKKSLYSKSSKHVRSLSEGAKDVDIKKHATTVQTYDASKYFRGTNDGVK
ncbi:uncharacterized protein LOC120343480 isoform X1 [Styela clava]